MTEQTNKALDKPASDRDATVDSAQSSVEDDNFKSETPSIETFLSAGIDKEEVPSLLQAFVKIHTEAFLEVDFEGLATLIGRWEPPDRDAERTRVLHELSGFLANHAVPSEITQESKILVCNRIPIEVEHGRDVSNFDNLLARMMQDSRVYGCVIAVVYGLMDTSVVNDLEDVISFLFSDEETPYAMVLC
jgi:hypothetical protein